MTVSRVPAILVLATTLCLAVGPVSAAQWYEANEFGVTSDEIAESAIGEYEYVVHVERSASLEVHTLFHDARAVERSELEYDGGTLRSRRRYVDDALVSTEHYRYWADGSLRVVRRIASGGASVEYRYREGRLEEEWVFSESSSVHTRYDEAGRLVERTTREDDGVVERETRSYWGEAPDAPLSEVVVFADGERTVNRYDESGRLLGSSVARDGEVSSDRIRVYEEGRLVEEREQREGVTLVWRYEYEGDELVTERSYEDGVLVKLIDYAREEFTRVESVYRDGDEALRVYYDGRDRVREEVVRDGEIIRTRTFGPPGGGS